MKESTEKYTVWDAIYEIGCWLDSVGSWILKLAFAAFIAVVAYSLVSYVM